MERIDPRSEGFVVLGEHVHRYKWAAGFARGVVLDSACGMGYGSRILVSNPRVTQYIGIDIDSQSISSATELYSEKDVKFITSSCENIPLDDMGVDTVISLETLEHLSEPELAVLESKRLLRDDGVYVGSVPDKMFEEICDRVYGKNPYHRTSFTEEALRQLLERHFKCVALYRSSVDIVSSIVAIEQANIDYNEPTVSMKQPLGSILFVATDDSCNLGARRSLDIEVLGNMVSYDDAFVFERDRVLLKQKNMIDERDELIARTDILVKELRQTINDQARRVDERDAIILSNEEKIDSLYTTIREQAVLVDERDELIGKYEAEMSALHTTIRDQLAMVEERDEVIKKYEAEVFALHMTIRNQAALVDERDKLIRKQEAEMSALHTTIRDQAALVDERDELIRKYEAEIYTLHTTISGAGRRGSKMKRRQ